MNRQDAQSVVTEYIKPIYGFALRRCKSIQDAEDLSQEIACKAFKALLVKDDIIDMRKFIWTVAHNVLSNYYRDSAKSVVGIPIDEVAEFIPASSPDSDGDDSDSINRLIAEIAYLSKMQRRIIIAFYFENRRQSDIAKELGIPLGTVKWHLFEAKKELKRGISKMRKTSELKFNPIKFNSYGINGSVGTASPDDYFRSILSQNICYCVRNSAKTVNEIADDLGVSPVYVEAEAEALEKYGLLLSRKDKYIINFIISEPTAELLIMQNNMYRRAAELFANELYDELVSSGILDDPGIICNQTDDPISVTKAERADHNFLLWSLIPFIAAVSGEKQMDNSISFEEVATIRPDGGHNIIHAAVVSNDIKLPDDYVYMNNWCGPMWNSNGRRVHWQVDSEWSKRDECRAINHQHSQDAMRILSLYEREHNERLSKDEYAWLAEQECIKTNGDYDGDFKSSWQIVILEDDVKSKLLSIGERIKIKHKRDFDELKAPYAKAVLESVPKHLQRVKEFELQFVYYSDGWFLLHCITALLKNGKLKEPTKEQRKSIMTIIA